MSLPTRKQDIASYKASCIDDLVEAGYVLIPCKGKIVNLKTNWRSIDPLVYVDAEDLPDNYAIVLQADDLVIDADARAYPEGRNSLEEFCQEYDLDLKKAFIVRTGSEQESWHIYFKKPRNAQCVVNPDKYKGVSLYSAGHYVIGPGSVHPVTKKVYKIAHNHPSTKAKLPKNVLDGLSITGDEWIKRDEVVVDASDCDATRRRYISFLEHCPPAIEFREGNTTTFNTALIGRDYGLNEDVVLELMLEVYNPRCSPPWDEPDLRTIVRNAFKYNRKSQGNKHPEEVFKSIKFDDVPDDSAAEAYSDIGWDVNREGRLKATRHNVKNAFLVKNTDEHKNPLYKILAYNSFDQNIEFTYPAPWHHPAEVHKQWGNNDTLMFQHYLKATYGFEAGKEVILDSVATIAYGQRYHPIRQYLERLEWDGVLRLDNWLTTYAGVEENEYTRAVGRCVLVAAVARVHKPGCQFDHMLVLEGEQGTGKSSLVRTLGGPYYGDIHIDPHSVNTIQNMLGCWFIEASELEVLRRADVSSLKAFLSRVEDRTRLPYKPLSECFARQCVFIGTINPDASCGYLTDTTGNRRFWPVKTSVISLDELKRDRDQLFAEAMARFIAGDNFYLDDPRLQKLAADETLQRMYSDPWLEVIQGYLAMYERYATPSTIVTTAEIATQALRLSGKGLDKMAVARIGNALHQLGYSGGRFWDRQCGKMIRGFKHEKFLTVDIKADNLEKDVNGES